MGLLASVLRDALLPLVVASLLVLFLADPARLDTSELLRNSLLMNTRPIFREVTAFDATANSAILLAAAIAAAARLRGVGRRLPPGWELSRLLRRWPRALERDFSIPHVLPGRQLHPGS
jgi:hypothetical protein